MRNLTVLSLLTILAACAQPRTVTVAPDDDYEPLEISLAAPSLGFGFWVNQPAYVAVFDITPGAGVRLAYPVVGAQLREKVTAGTSFVRAMSRRPHLFASRRLSEPHIILAIASRRPLNISHTAGYGEWISYKLGAPYFLGSTLGIPNQLLDEVVPAQPGGDWATAMYLVYPDLDWRENVWQLVRCPDGLIYLVNSEARLFQCPPATQSAPATPRGIDSLRGRRPGQGEMVTPRSGTAVTRSMRTAELPVLQARNGIVRRPPDPPSGRSTPGYVRRNSAGSTRAYEYGSRATPGRVSDVTATPSESGTTISRPVSLDPPAPPPAQQPPQRRGEKPTKADP